MRLPLALILACFASAAHAVEDFGTPLMLATLNATVVNVSMNVVDLPSSTLQGNVISDVGNNTFGVISIVQNTGAQANVQQSVMVSIGTLNFTPLNLN